MTKLTDGDVKDFSDELDVKYFMAISVGEFVALPLGSSLTPRPEVLYT